MWEAIGVVSYLLINFYFTRIQANKAAILAFTMNRQGDMLMSIGFFAIFALFGTLNYSSVFSLTPYMNETAITIIALLLFGGACAKSAQIPLHSWLPGSMEAPTPVSALLHAATLVTAGIYLLLRCSPILEYSPTALMVITIVGASTAFFAATSGLVQNDLKRIIAFSTISQLGYYSYLIFIPSLFKFFNIYFSQTVIGGGNFQLSSSLNKSMPCLSTRNSFVIQQLMVPTKGSAVIKQRNFNCNPIVGGSRKRYFSAGQVIKYLNPWYITGITDAEGTFSFSVVNNKASKLGWTTKVIFSIGVHQKDLVILEGLKSYFGVGNIYLEKERNVARYSVETSKNLIEVIIPHFNEYPLITQKQADFLLFKEAVKKIYRKEHLNQTGLEEILSLKASSNLGLSHKLQSSFPYVKPYPRPSILNQTVPHPYWLVGFVEGDGGFFIRKSKNSTLRYGYQYSLVFELSQNNRDTELFFKIKEYLDCGNVTLDSSRNSCRYIITSFTDIHYKLIPLFNKYPMQGIKQLNFLDFCKGGVIVQNKGHLTPEGIEELEKIRSSMNDSRPWTPSSPSS